MKWSSFLINKVNLIVTSTFSKSLAANLTDVIPDVQVYDFDVLFLKIEREILEKK
jgi:hypothetical protein